MTGYVATRWYRAPEIMVFFYTVRSRYNVIERTVKFALYQGQLWGILSWRVKKLTDFFSRAISLILVQFRRKNSGVQ